MSTKELESIWSVEESAFPSGESSRIQYKFLLRYAALAPSSHNSQPWLFDVNQDAIVLYSDPTRALPVVDPENRELIISCGAALEFLCVSARHFGYLPDVTFENSDCHPDFLARFSFGKRRDPDAIENALFGAIPKRRTNRMKFETTNVPLETIEQVQTLSEIDNVKLKVVTSRPGRNEVAGLVAKADRIQAADPKFRRELAAWVHSNRSHSRDGLPGYALGMGDIQSAFGPLVVRTFDWGAGKAAKDEQLISGSPLLAALATRNDLQSDWLNTGRALAKTLLMLTHHDLSASFLNQPIEVAKLRTELQSQLGISEYPQILLRIGYGPMVKPTPRRPIEEIILRQHE